MCCTCCGRERAKYNRIKQPFDICVLYEGCDSPFIAPLLQMMDYQRADGTDIRVFPRDHKSLDDYAAAMEAMDHSHAILIVLSDKSAGRFTGEHGNEDPFFQLIERACEKEKENSARILPLFMSHHIEYEGQVGTVKFGTWAYKCKNEHVRAYIEHIGSLQGLFVDPSDWGAKWDKLYGFWEESHDELVPLTLWNFCQEVDFPRIRRMLGGGCVGLFCGMCCACVPGKSKFWHECRMGLVMGNMACYIAASIILFVVGFYINCNYDAGNPDTVCTTTQNVLFISGSIVAILGFMMGIFVYVLSRRRFRTKLPPQLAALNAQQVTVV